MEVLSSDDDAPDSPVILEVPRLPPPTPGCIPTYKKSLRLSSEQIVSAEMGRAVLILFKLHRAKRRYSSPQASLCSVGSFPDSLCLNSRGDSLFRRPAHFSQKLGWEKPSHVLKYLPAVSCSVPWTPH